MVTKEVHWSYKSRGIVGPQWRTKEHRLSSASTRECTEVMRCNNEVPIFPYTQYAMDLSDGITIETTG
jgi:hypothetical protein